MASDLDNIPTVFLPFLSSLLHNGEPHDWLAQFYREMIEKRYHSFIENVLFGEASKFETYYPHATDTDKLSILKSYFTKEKIAPYSLDTLLGSLKTQIRDDTERDNFHWAWPAQKVEGTLAWHLQNALSRAIAKYDDVSVGTYISESVNVTLREMIELQILFYMKNKIAVLSSKIEKDENQEEKFRLDDLDAWVSKEMSNRVPSQVKLVPSFTPKNKSKLLQSAPKLKGIPNPVMYFFNGTTRLPLFVQNEYIKLSEIGLKFKGNVERFANGAWRAEDLYLNLPLASLRFFLDVGFVALLPYRLLRTLVNEITSSTFKILRNLMSPFMPESRGKKAGLFGLYYGSQIVFYGFLLMSLGLPIFPNPISWLPEGFIFGIPLIAGSYFLSTITGGFLYKWFSKNKTERFPAEASELGWVPLKPYVPEAKPIFPTLALYDAPKPYQVMGQFPFAKMGPFLPLEQQTQAVEEKIKRASAPAA